MTDVPSDDQVRAEAERVERGARMAYAAYKTQRELAEGDSLPPWERLCERKRARFRAAALALITFLRLEAVPVEQRQ